MRAHSNPIIRAVLWAGILSNSVRAENLIEKHLPQMSAKQKLASVAALEAVLQKKLASIPSDSTDQALVDTQIELGEEFKNFSKQSSLYHNVLAGVSGTSAVAFLMSSLGKKKKSVKVLAQLSALSFTGTTLYLGFESKKVARKEALERINTLMEEIQGLKALLIYENQMKKVAQEGYIRDLGEDAEEPATEHSLPDSK